MKIVKGTLNKMLLKECTSAIATTLFEPANFLRTCTIYDTTIGTLTKMIVRECLHGSAPLQGLKLLS